MWNDAFQNNYGNMQKRVVPLVPVVPSLGESSPEPFLVEPKRKIAEKSFGSTGSKTDKVEPVEPFHKTVLFNFGSAKSQAGGRSVEGGTSGTTGTTQKQHQQQMHGKSMLSVLKKFQFDQFLIDIKNGHPADDGCRVNNIAWQFMQSEGMDFDEAIKKAAVLVASGKVAACEAAYIDVMDLFKRLTQ